MFLDDLVDQPVSGCLRSTHEVVAVGITLNDLQRLAGIGSQDLVELRARLQNLLGVDFDVACLPFAPAASRNAPIDAAIPMQMVETSHLMKFIVS